MKHPESYETDERTSKRMANVKLKHGNAEKALAHALWQKKYRYWLNYKKVPGSPDIAIKKYNVAVFVDGEFWHGYHWADKKEKIRRNREYWVEKIEENIARDNRNDKELKAMGWIPIHFWSKEVLKDPYGCANDIENLIIDIIAKETSLG
jgi:DNA mismatch endonuclease (patch repair protein)